MIRVKATAEHIIELKDRTGLKSLKEVNIDNSRIIESWPYAYAFIDRGTTWALAGVIEESGIWEAWLIVDPLAGRKHGVSITKLCKEMMSEISLKHEIYSFVEVEKTKYNSFTTKVLGFKLKDKNVMKYGLQHNVYVFDREGG